MNKLSFLVKPILIILVFILALWLIGFLNRPSSPSSPSLPSFTLSPNQGEFTTGQEFSLEIILKANKEINAADAVLVFDPEILEAVTLKPGTIFPLYPRKNIDLEKGRAVITGVKTSQDGQVFEVHYVVAERRRGDVYQCFILQPILGKFRKVLAIHYAIAVEVNV